MLDRVFLLTGIMNRTHDQPLVRGTHMLPALAEVSMLEELLHASQQTLWASWPARGYQAKPSAWPIPDWSLVRLHGAVPTHRASLVLSVRSLCASWGAS